MLGLGAGPAGMQLPRVALSLTSLHCACRTVHRVVSDFGTSCVMTETAAPRRERAGWDQRLQRVAVEKKPRLHSLQFPNPLPCWFHAAAVAAVSLVPAHHRPRPRLRPLAWILIFSPRRQGRHGPTRTKDPSLSSPSAPPEPPCPSEVPIAALSTERASKCSLSRAVRPSSTSHKRSCC